MNLLIEYVESKGHYNVSSNDVLLGTCRDLFDLARFINYLNGGPGAPFR